MPTRTGRDGARSAAPPGEVRVRDFWAWDRLARARGWTDGLPVAPPTPRRVDALIAASGLPADHCVGTVPPAGGLATVEQVAIQCAMAGCLPEQAPVVLAALEAMLEPTFNLHGVQTTTNPCAPLVIVSGPIVDGLGFNRRDGAFGGGGHANVAVGRAIRLVLWNIGGGRPNDTDKSPLGQPGKLAFCVAENQPDSPWTSIRAEAGFAESDSCVTVFACQSPYPAVMTGTPERILRVIAQSLPSPSLNAWHSGGELLLVFSLQPVRILANAGWSKAAVRRWLFEHAGYLAGGLRLAGIDPLDTDYTYWGAEELREAGGLADDRLLPLLRREEDLHILVTGGDGQGWGAYCPGWGDHGGAAITRRIAA